MTPKTLSSAVIRLARQNKSTRKGKLVRKQAATMIWNVASQQNPFGPRSNQFDNSVYNTFQTAELGNQLTSSSGGETDYAQYFTLNQIQGISSYTSTFDQYWIKQIECEVTPSSSTAINVDNFRWLCVVDYDDAATPTFNGLLQYSNVSDLSRVEGCMKRFVPHVAISISNNSSSSGARNEPSGWIDSASPDRAHYGVKVSMSATSTTVVLALRVRFLVAFRNAI